MGWHPQEDAISKKSKYDKKIYSDSHHPDNYNISKVAMQIL